MSRKVLIIPIVVISILALSGCDALSNAGKRIGEFISGEGRTRKIQNDTRIEPVGTLLFYEGEILVNGTSIEIGDEIIDGDVLSVSEDGYAEVIFGEHRVLRAGAGTLLTFNAAEQAFVLDSGSLGVLQSKARALVNDDPWELQTPTVVAAVRGTTYFVNVEDDDQVYFCLCNGRIHLEDSDHDHGLDMEAAHHDAVRFLRTDDGVVYSDAPMLYHNDREMESLADLVGVPIDWTRIAN